LATFQLVLHVAVGYISIGITCSSWLHFNGYYM